MSTFLTTYEYVYLEFFCFIEHSFLFNNCVYYFSENYLWILLNSYNNLHTKKNINK